jgi:hypothetical protein
MFANHIEKIISDNTDLDAEHLDIITRHGYDLPKAIANNVINAARKISQIENQLNTMIKIAQGDLEAAADVLDPRHSARTAALRESATKIDMLAARHQDAYKHLIDTCRAFKALP